MIVGISGAQGVGKSTLLSALRKSKLVGKYHFKDEVTRWVKSIGLQINEGGDDLTQRLIAMRHVYNIKTSEGNMISDRTMLDCLVYTRYLHEKNQVSKDCLHEIENIFRLTRYDYDLTFYVEPEVALVDDGVRSVNEDFRKRIIELFEIAIFEDMDDDVVRIKGTVEERTNQVVKIIKQYEIEEMSGIWLLN